MDIDALKDDSSWRRLTTLLHEVAVADEQLAIKTLEDSVNCGHAPRRQVGTACG
jgi:hypothetical protein